MSNQNYTGNEPVLFSELTLQQQQVIELYRDNERFKSLLNDYLSAKQAMKIVINALNNFWQLPAG